MQESGHAPGFRGALLAGHEHAAVVADALGLVHRSEELRPHGDLARADRLDLVGREGEAVEKESDDGLFCGHFLSKAHVSAL